MTGQVSGNDQLLVEADQGATQPCAGDPSPIHTQTRKCPGQRWHADPGRDPYHQGRRSTMNPIPTGSPTPDHHPGPMVHPGWCDPRECRTDLDDVQHSATPIRLRARDVVLTFAWVSTNSEHPELRVDVGHATLTGRDTAFYLLPQEVHRIRERLGTEYHRQKFLTAPMLRDTATPTFGGAA